MLGQKNRYFIELQANNTGPIPRYMETELRRKLATEFIKTVGEWLKEQSLEDKVLAMAITALGQVQITCDADVISQIRRQEIMEIAEVRQSSLMSENFNRWNDLGVQTV